MSSMTSPGRSRSAKARQSTISSLLTGASKPDTVDTTAEDAVGVLQVAPDGDLILDLHHEEPRQDFSFRVMSISLSQRSSYFRLLLDPGRYEEGRRLAASKHEPASVNGPQSPPADLPRIAIHDIGRISAVRSIKPLMLDLLHLLHGRTISSSPPPISNLANLVVVADRFDALDTVKAYARSQSIFQSLDTKYGIVRTKVITNQPETRLRQRAFIAVQLDHHTWLVSGTQALIRQGPTPASHVEEPAWSDLPHGIEDELHHRRLAILDTIHSIQTYFLAQYISRTRQCRLGYDSSGACDSFQLGQMVRFLSRIGTLGLGSSLLPPNHVVQLDPDTLRTDPVHNPGYTGDLLDLLDKLRQCPTYQIDSNHHHCGLRTRIMPLVDLLEKAIEDVGVCGDCWRERRAEYAWFRAKRPLTWTRGAGVSDGDLRSAGRKVNGAGGAGGCLETHLAGRNMFLARERIWERPRDGSESAIAFGQGLTLGWRA